MMELPISFIHSAPKSYSYEVTPFKRNVVAIWILNHGNFSYTDKTPRSIWGFYNTKTREYSSPVNATKQGDIVDIEDTTPYSSMQIKYQGIEAFFV